MSRQPADHLQHIDRSRLPRIWGLDAEAIHRAFWSSHGVSSVSFGRPGEIDRGADLFLLLEPGQLVVFDLRSVAETLLWGRAELIMLTIRDEDQTRYQERAVVDASGSVVRIERRYGNAPGVAGRVLLARRAEDAEAWSRGGSPDGLVARLRGRRDFARIECTGRRYVDFDRDSIDEFMKDVIARWSHPDRVIDGLQSLNDGVFGPAGLQLGSADRCVGPLWIGHVRTSVSEPGLLAIGPGFVADSDGVGDGGRPATVRAISEIFSPSEIRRRASEERRGGLYPMFKRGMDILFATLALLVFSPVLALCAIAVVVDDGFPVFFGHARQKQGGRVFKCWKFRTMRRDAEARLGEFQRQNLCDGPQVLIRDDPRITRVGKHLRKFQLDEFPQFWNVILGDMSVVGPRPSPEKENQFCPAWRETRLSVRPGITGLWQVMRTRAPGRDFQEWIKYDIEYVERMGPWLDIWIVWQTVVNLLGASRARKEQA